MDSQEQLEIGRQAEEFLRYTEEHLYFTGLIERIKLTYAQRILSLNPDQGDAFSVLKERMDVWDEILNAVRGDISVASEALKQLEGVPEKGLL